ncbi:MULTISPECIES: tetratricopeptide repeat protein [Dyella]|uniref:Tetratricopeptide repeat protein n=2 Tax=Dyella TaxID=231454 RepID=A0A4R0YLR7_9GAMM|nr:MULTISPECIES: tetratricopeptide repeat protein [Dyella]TBR36500.1 tetratricopeptide repeat protein [Dyella terrae]TCI08408.1 tetratricopeptide repeat protein [Dyella soli]
MSTMIDNLRAQCGGPRDGALLRFSLGNALSGEGRHAEAVEELRRAVQFDPGYSAAWKLLGKTLVALEDNDAAADAYHHGITAARARGDKQAEKEMTVFLRRLGR